VKLIQKHTPTSVCDGDDVVVLLSRYFAFDTIKQLIDQ